MPAGVAPRVLERLTLQPEQQISSNWFVARDAPLADLVEKLRRYSPRPISIVQPGTVRTAIWSKGDATTAALAEGMTEGQRLRYEPVLDAVAKLIRG